MENCHLSYIKKTENKINSMLCIILLWQICALWQPKNLEKIGNFHFKWKFEKNCKKFGNFHLIFEITKLMIIIIIIIINCGILCAWVLVISLLAFTINDCRIMSVGMNKSLQKVILLRCMQVISGWFLCVTCEIFSNQFCLKCWGGWFFSLFFHL